MALAARLLAVYPAGEFGVPSTTISLTLSGYFIGLALGQVVYGPLLDRFGRKRPLAAVYSYVLPLT